MKNNIQTYIQFYLDDVELNISVTSKLKKQEGNLKGFGYIQVSSGETNAHECFWDGIEFFKQCDYKTFKEECKGDLEKGEYPVKQTYKAIKKLLKRAKKLNLLQYMHYLFNEEIIEDSVNNLVDKIESTDKEENINFGEK